ncbi:hypothetical protein FOMPIDRAFT_86366 [Fomitopsis schrenkii]|uniref:Uncharacterized protein n=1 Tax=Fomitopsis schrenkii TaxID=2126942 RepID=S8FD36_FOMSC|nr:hypothetical protein FOMPIDRAFT_86366 [Fomitopsis schrenkii]
MESGNCEHGHAGDRSRRIGSSSQYGQWMVRPRPKLGVPTSKNSCATDEELDLSVGPTSDVQASDECPGRGVRKYITCSPKVNTTEVNSIPLLSGLSQISESLKVGLYTGIGDQSAQDVDI